MALTDQDDKNAAQTTKITGASSNGTETAFINSQNINGTDALSTVDINGQRQTYSAAITALVAASTPTDVFTISGSATKTIRITRIELSATESTGAIKDIQLLKRSSLDSGGTSSTLTNVPHDSNNAAGTAVVKAYTANPSSLGTLVGMLRSNNTGVPAANLNASISPLVWDFTTRQAQGIVLRGVNENIAINLNGSTANGNSWNISVEWTEE